MDSKFIQKPLSAFQVADALYKDIRASDGYVKDFPRGSTNPSNAPQVTESQYDVLFELYKADSVVRASIETVAEESVKNRGYFLGSKTANLQAEKLFSRIDFYALAEAHVRSQHLYGNSYIEYKIGDDGKSEVYPLETSQIFIGYNPNGKIDWFGQNVLPGESMPVVLQKNNFSQIWSPDQVLFLPLIRLGSRVNSIMSLEPALRAMNIRQNAHMFIDSIFKNFRPQSIFSIENNVSPDQVQSLVSAIRAADKDPSKKILSVGDLKVQTSGMYEFKRDIVDILNYVRQEILSVTRVPGSYIGITDNSNRGISEMEAAAFQAHLLRVQRDIEKLANWILDKEGIKAVFKCKPPSIKSQTDLIDQAKKLRDMGYGSEVITPFLYENGINVPQDAEFEQQNKVSMDMQPSRQGSGKGVTEGKYNLDSTGRSQAGMDKMAQTDKKLRGSEFHDI